MWVLVLVLFIYFVQLGYPSTSNQNQFSSSQRSQLQIVLILTVVEYTLWLIANYYGFTAISNELNLGRLNVQKVLLVLSLIFQVTETIQYLYLLYSSNQKISFYVLLASFTLIAYFKAFYSLNRIRVLLQAIALYKVQFGNQPPIEHMFSEIFFVQS